MVIDSVYRTPVSNAVVSVNGTRYGMLTNGAGEFFLTIPSELRPADAQVTVFSAHYKLQTAKIDGNDDYIIVSLVPLVQEQKDLTLGLLPNKPYIKKLEKLVQIVVDDWYPLGDSATHKFDFGRIQNSIMLNPLEAFRVRGGVASTSNLHPNIFTKGYVAYGFKDKKLKYRGELVYSLDPRIYHDGEFPKRNFGMVYEYDFWAYGEKHARELNDELLQSYIRSKDGIIYRRFFEINADVETPKGMAFTAWWRRSTLTPSRLTDFHLLSTDTLNKPPVNHIRFSEAGLRFRYSIGGESYIQNGRSRTNTSLTNPVVYLSHSVGLWDKASDEQTPFFQRTELSLQKRFAFGKKGRLDVVADAQKIWGTVPFPLLIYPNQRIKGVIENNGFYLNPAIEFAGDEQYTLRTTFVGDELFLYKIPLLNKLSVKELVSFRIMKSMLSNKNIPTLYNQLPEFPSQTFIMGKAPYMEAAIGLTNILGLARIEYVHRINYRKNPGAILGRVRVNVTIKFTNYELLFGNLTSVLILFSPSLFFIFQPIIPHN